jgi:pyrroline-5-carboxylate reductase
MKNKNVIAIIGGGNIGLAIAEGLLTTGIFSGKIIITRKNSDFSEEEKNKFECLKDNKKAVEKAGIVVIAVQPSQFNELALDIKDCIKKEQLIISVVTGLRIEDIATALSEAKAIARVMLNIAIKVGKSMTFVALNSEGKKNQKTIELIFSSVGKIIFAPESKFNAATVLSGSGIALAMKFLRAYMQAGIQNGFNEHDALRIAKEVMKGAITILDKNGNHPESEIDKVTSPGGCTIDALAELEHSGFTSALLKAVRNGTEKAGALYTKK